MKRKTEWYCPTCDTFVPPEHVTYEEQHDVRAGGCGGTVVPDFFDDPALQDWISDKCDDRYAIGCAMAITAIYIAYMIFLAFAPRALEDLLGESMPALVVGVYIVAYILMAGCLIFLSILWSSVLRRKSNDRGNTDD